MERHGGYRYSASEKSGIPIEQWIDFSANINPLGVPKSVYQAIIEGLNQLEHYPDPECLALTKALAEYERVEQNRIFCGNGGADVLYRYFHVQKPKKTLLPVPTFVEYEDILSRLDGEIVHYKMNDTFTIGEDFILEMEQKVDLVILCTPNNPTGISISKLLLNQIVEKAERLGIQVLMDVSFREFLVDKEEEQYRKLKQKKHVTILHSFTKMFAIPALRLGYAILGDGETKERMREQGASWSVNHLAQAAGIAALKEKNFVQQTVDYVAKERTYLIKNLRNLGFRVIDGEANYLLIQTKKVSKLQERLEKKKILIRDCSNYQNLSEGYYRIAVKKHEENEYLLDCLREVME